jgi:hypothetical protein
MKCIFCTWWPCDLDLWTCVTKINGCSDLTKGYSCAEFGLDGNISYGYLMFPGIHTTGNMWRSHLHSFKPYQSSRSRSFYRALYTHNIYALYVPVTSTFDPLLLNSTSVQLSPSAIHVPSLPLMGPLWMGIWCFQVSQTTDMNVCHIDLISHPIDLQGQSYFQVHCTPITCPLKDHIIWKFGWCCSYN